MNVKSPEHDQFTESEKRWWKRLERVLKDQPQGIDLVVYLGGTLTAHRKGRRQEYFNERENLSPYGTKSWGDMDNVPNIDSLSGVRIYPAGEAL